MRADLLLVLALSSVAGQGTAPPATGPCAKRGIAGLGALVGVSRIEIGADANRLTAAYLFDDRARWHFEAYAQRRSQHVFVHRSGEHVFQFESGATCSRESEGAERDAVLLQMELRRAVMLWPDGFDWAPAEDGTRRAPVSLHACRESETIGSLVAVVEGDRPTRVEARGADGTVREWLEIRAWREDLGRRWPREMLLHQGERTLKETVEEIATDAHFLDFYFLPPDRRTRTGAADAIARVRPIDLVAITYQGHPLPADVAWPAALESARAWIAEAGDAQGERGLAIDPIPTFELSPEGRPARCLVRLSQPARPPPAGWTTLEDRPGLMILAEEPGAIDAALLGLLSTSAPPGSRPGTPYVRFHQTGRIEVDLPLETAR